MTFLVNKRMHPALAARIEASVTGSKPTRGRPQPRTVAIVRIAFFIAMALFAWAVLSFSQRPQVHAPRPAATTPASSAQK